MVYKPWDTPLLACVHEELDNLVTQRLLGQSLAALEVLDMRLNLLQSHEGGVVVVGLDAGQQGLLALNLELLDGTAGSAKTNVLVTCEGVVVTHGLFSGR